MRRKVDPRHDLLPRPFPKGNALRDRGRYGAGELQLGVEQRIIPGGHEGLYARLQQMTDATLLYLARMNGMKFIMFDRPIAVLCLWPDRLKLLTP